MLSSKAPSGAATNGSCCPETRRKAQLGHRTTMIVTLRNTTGIPTVQQVSHGRAVTQVVQIVQKGAIQPHHKVFMSPAQRREAPAKIRFQVAGGELTFKDFDTALKVLDGT
mmetsp:Transcript_2234/g.4118  ORF Transcript_2234/g.4118 Transcript_2234/m.4118 type:complete len:111 (-) Transcript_2234:107-439(-)